MDNHFDLFQMPARFAIDAAQLDAAYREVQGRVHPDKFAAASDAEKRVAMQWATRANEAYKTLKNPLRRAAYLCELNGVDLGIESNTTMPTAFLMQQMEWRESLDEARSERDTTRLEALEQALNEAHRQAVARIAELLEQSKFSEAGERVRELMFVEKFGDEVASTFEALEA
ncbi:DjlA DnaJ-domain-containing proteins 1 [Oxalobacteraceae bacterium]|jgi:molecular chaperone HscB